VTAHLDELHARRVARERRRCFVEASIVNGVLVLYAIWGVAHLALASGIRRGLWPVVLIASAGAGVAWTLAPGSFGRLIFERTNPVLKTRLKPSKRRWVTSFSGLFSLGLLVLTLVLGWNVTGMSLQRILSQSGLAGARNLFGQLLTPSVEGEFLLTVLNKMVETVFLALMATLIAVPVAFVASFFCARNLMKGHLATRGVYVGLRVIFNFMRSVEPLVWAIIFSVWVGIGPYAGMLALMVHSVAALSKLYSEQIESIDRKILEAIEATGANRVQVVWYAVVPQIILPYLSFTIYRWDINVRMATVIGLVGGGGVGQLLMQYQGLAMWSQVGTIVIVIGIVVWIMDYLSARIREAIY
jgi:phosphonate transport system permease protein